MRFFFSSDRHVDTPTIEDAFAAELIDEGGAHAEVQHARIFVWNGAAWAKMTQPGGAGGGDGSILDGVSPTIKATVFDYANSNPLAVTLVDATGAQYNASGGGGGGAVTIADGADVAQGTTTDLSTANTVVGILKAIKAAITGTLATSRTWVLASGTDSVNVGNFPATQVVTEASLDAAIAAQGTAVPANVDMAGMRNSAGNADRLQGVSDNANTVAASGGGNSLRSAALNFLWDGTNWQRFQGTTGGLLKVDASGVAIPVTGTFWQATQPVSGPLTDTQLRASAITADTTVATEVTGTLGANGQVIASTDARAYKSCSIHLTGTLVGTVTLEGSNDNADWQAITVVKSSVIAGGAASPVTGITTIPSLYLANLNFHFIRLTISAFASGSVTATVDLFRGPMWYHSNSVAQGASLASATPWTQNLTQVGGTAVAATSKGTQGTNFVNVQEAKDSGRVNIMWTAEFAFAQVAETLLTLTESRDGAATSTFSTKVVTSGKRLRITGIYLEAESLGTGTTPQRCYLRMRFNTAGAVTAASALQGVWGLGVTTAIVKASEKEAWDFPDGIEFLGDGTKQIGFTLETPDWVVTTGTGRAKITITAFEY